MDKPTHIFDRDSEWSQLSRFATYDGPEPALGVVSGRRRQGKTFLLDELCRVTGGFFYSAIEAREVVALHQFGTAVANYLGMSAPIEFRDWEQAVGLLMTSIATDGQPRVVVIDEFQFLARASPELPSLIQNALGRPRREDWTPVRLLLCGSALSFMGKLLYGTAPLRGRAKLDMRVRTFDFRVAARFWEVSEPRLAILLNAVIGGTPAYAREFSYGDSPQNVEDFDRWVVSNVLEPSSPLFREARSILVEDPEIRDPAAYEGVLFAIAEGNHTRGGIANFLRTKATDLGHALTVLEDIGMIAKEPDAFRNNRSIYRIDEPLLSFYHAVMLPVWSELERAGMAGRVWERARPSFLSNVVGPHFEHICREWVRWYAAEETVGGYRSRVGSGVVTDSAQKMGHEIDVAVFGREGGGEELLAIGEVKWNQVMDMGHLRRLEHARGLLGSRGYDVSGTRLMCFSGSGFSKELMARADQSADVQLVDPHRLYFGE